MPRLSLLLALCTLTALGLAPLGCGDDDRSRVRDSGADSTAPPTDSMVPMDSAVPPRDSAVPPGDSAVPPRDSAVPPRDSAVVDSAVVDSAVVDSGPVDGAVPDAGPPPTPARGTYRYTRLPIGGLSEAHRVAFHPDGSYAVYLERNDVVHLYDWATETDRVVDLAPARGTLRLGDVVFEPGGEAAWVVGSVVDGSAETTIVYRLDDAAVRAGSVSVFTEQSASRSGELLVAVELPPGGGEPMMLTTTSSSPWIARLRSFDETTGDFGSFVTAVPTSAGCDDVAYVINEFGGPGYLIVCGAGGADTRYWTEIGGVPEWRAKSGGTLGNTSRVARHGDGDYALLIGWSGRRVYRFEGGAWNDSSTAPWFTRIGIYAVAFQREGQRALVVGRAGSAPVRGTVLEYRHDLYSMADITEVSIPSFDAPPYNADTNTYLYDAAFRPGCDGGLLVGGRTSFSGSTGYLIEFAIEGARACPRVPPPE